MSANQSKRSNWTDRITIDKSCVDITREDVALGQPKAVTIDLDLSEYSFPKSAVTVVNASHRLTLMRFEFGTIVDVIPSLKLDFSEFPSQSLPTFRFLVLDKEHSLGRLLGNAERTMIADSEPSEESRNIFKVDGRDLGEEVWKVEFDIDDYPMQLINKKVPTFIYRLEWDKVIQGLTLPVASKIALSELASSL